MKKTVLFISIVCALLIFISCESENKEKTDNKQNGTVEKKIEPLELTDAELLEFLSKKAQKGWIKPGYSKGNYYFISFLVDYNDHSIPAWMDIYDSEKSMRDKYEYWIEDGVVKAMHEMDSTEITLEITIFDDENITINGEKFVPLSNKVATEIRSE